MLLKKIIPAIMVLMFGASLATAQVHFTFTSNTGNNALVAVPTAANPNIGGVALSNGDEIGAFTPAGLCVGAVVWNSANTSLTVWGDNALTPAVDGIVTGETIHYRVWDQSASTEYSNVSVTYSLGNGIYAPNGINALSSLSVAATPSAPALSAPTNSATGVAILTPFSWSASSGATSYGLQVATDTGFTSIVINQTGLTGTSYTLVTPLSNNTLYYWRMNATNGSGTSSWSGRWSFTTIVAAPSAPALSAPANSSTGVAILTPFSWSASSGATSYGLEVATDAGFTSIVVNQTGLTGTSYTLVSPLSNNTLYYWRMNATNAGGTSAWSGSWSYTTIVAIPATPILSAPANTSTGVAILTPFNWSASSGATSYGLEVATDAGFTSIVVNQTGLTGTSYTLVSPLSNNTLYYWRMNATNAGGTSSWSGGWSFTTIVAAPAAPVLSAPANTTTGVAILTPFSWSASSGATSYGLEVATDAGFTSIVVNQTGLTGTSYTLVSPLSNNTLYYWRMNATNAGGTSAWSGAWSYTTIVGAPAAPVLSAPANTSTGVAILAPFSWSASSGATSYGLQVATDAGFTSIVVNQTGLTGTSYTLVTPLSNNTLYYWRMNATNAGGTGSWSTGWSFTTIVAAPAAPVLSAPANTTTGVAILTPFNWTASSGATSYGLQVATDAGFTSIVVNQTSLTGTSYTLVTPLSNNTLYYWRMNATNAGGTSAWSGSWSYTTIVGPPAAPVLSAPANTTTGVAILTPFSWSASSGATSYGLQVATDAGFTSIVVNQTGLTGTSYTLITPLLNNTLYYWRMNAANAGGTGSWSTGWSYTSVVAIPATPVLSAPANTSTGIAILTPFSWSASSGATSYGLQVSTDAGFTSIVVNQTGLAGTSYTLVTPLSNNTLYYWRMNATNAGGTSAWSGAWSYTTIVAVPGVPTLVSPLDAAINVPLLTSFSWSSVSGATSYGLQVSTDPAFGTTVVNQTGLTGTSYTLVSPLAYNTIYYWRMNSTGAGGTSSWSSPWDYTTIVAAPSAPTFVSPANGSTGVPILTSFNWNASSGATSYGLEVATDAGFTSIVVNQTGLTGTSYTLVTPLANNILYYWRMNATNAGGTSTWSGGWSFTTIVTAPVVPVLSAPANSATGVAILTPFSWSASSGATSYGLQVATDAGFTSIVVNQTGLTGTSYTLVSPLANNTLYYWRMNATNFGGTSAWSGAWSYTTIVAAPSVPVLGAPANSATGVALLTPFSWSASSGATSYGLQVATDAGFTSIVVNQTGLTGTSYTLVTPLTNNTLYYWRMNATNAGGTSSWSAGWSYTTIVAAPSAPTFVSPANTATGVPLLTSYGWNASSGATSYGLQVATDAGFTSIVVNQTGLIGTSYTLISPLVNNTPYYWRMNATNAGGTSAWSGGWSYTTIVAAPSVPVLSAPVNSATGVAILTPFSWSASSGAISYGLQVATDAGFTSIVVNQTGLTGTSYTLVTPLTNNTLYYWRMNATNAGGTSSWSAGWSYTTIVAIPATPVLSTPANSATGVAILTPFTWSASSGATSYGLQVATDAGFTSIVVNQTGLTGTSYTLVSPLSNNTLYYWRMNATNAAGTSAWSGSWSYTTIVAIPSAPVLSTPANGATGVAVSTAFNWSASSGATSYGLQVAADAGFTSIIVNQTGLTGTSYTLVTPLANNTLYYYRMNATNAGGTSGWSGSWSFTTIVVAPGVPTLVSPSNGAVSVPLLSSFSWNSVAGATSYALQVSTDPAFGTTVVNQTGLTGTSYTLLSPLTNNTLYYWRMNSTDAGGTSSWSAPWSYTTIVVAPSVPTLISPANAATGIAVLTPFSWSASSGATSYGLQVSTDPGFGSTVVNQTGLTGTSYTLVTPLSNNTLYYWRMNATNAGGTSAWSGGRSYTTIIAAPSAPVLSAPANSATSAAILTPFNWSTSSGATSYGLQVSTDPAFGTTVVNQTGLTGTSYTLVTPLSNNTLYYWRMNATNAGGTSAWSGGWSFTTIVTISSAPVLITPANGATGVATSTAFSWSASSGAASYGLQISIDPGFGTTVVNQTGLTGTSYTLITPLTNNTLYYWRMNATNAAGTGSWSGSQYFTTVVAASGVPTLISPSNAAISVPLLTAFSWSTIATATSYGLQVSTDPGFGTTVVNQTGLTGTSYTLVTPLANNTLYYWRMNATNSGGTSAWSASWSFTTIVVASGVPTLVSPANTSTGVAILTPFNWSASSGATSYGLQVSTDPGFGSTIVNQTGLTGTSYTLVTPLSNNTLYYWRMNATNAGGTSSWSGVWSFTTIVAAPGVPILASPLNGAVSVPLLTLFTWNSAAGATSYGLQVSTDPAFGTTVVNQTGLTGTSYTLVSPLANNTLYYWRMNATNAGGTSAWVEYDYFTTIVAASGVPTLISPSNGATSVHLLASFNWGTATGSTSSALQVSTDPAFGTTVVNQSGLTGTSYNLVTPLVNNTLYYWRMNATSAGGTSSWSASWSFTTIVAFPLVPILDSPDSSGVNPPVNTILRWRSSGDGVTYRLQLATDSTFSSIIADTSNLADTSYSPDHLLGSTKYFWRVSATNASGTTDWSPTGSFRTQVVTSIDGIGNEIPKEYALQQNFPNPFNPTTTIRFDIVKEGNVELTIYDILGKEVTTLISDHLNPGHYQIGWNAAGNASGIYFYRLQTGNFVAVKRLMLLK